MGSHFNQFIEIIKPKNILNESCRLSAKATFSLFSVVAGFFCVTVCGVFCHIVIKLYLFLLIW